MSFDPQRKALPADDLSTTTVWTPTPRPGVRSACQVGRRLGAGGFAEVFEAQLFHPQKPPLRIALKRLLPSLRGDPLRQRQLRREAQIGTALHHPNIVRVLQLVEFGEGKNGQFGEVALAMELCEGMPGNHLLHRLAQQRLALSGVAVAHIASGLFSALKYLENPFAQSDGEGPIRSLVHADVSLENLMLAKNGDVKLIDFGIAGEDAAPADPRHEEALTSLHQAAGKRPYLPPEGMPARGPSSKSDIYAAGVCFWELCTGFRFPVLPTGIGEREMGSIIAFAAAEQPAPAWRLLHSCLAISPETRLASAAEGLALCEELVGAAKLAPELGALVTNAMAQRPLAESAIASPSDFLTTLLRRLHHAFCAHRVSAFAPLGDDPSGMVMSEPLFAPAAQHGEAGGSIPNAELLREALDSGFVETADGDLLFRVRPPGERAHVVLIEPGEGCGYDPLAQSLLRNLLQTASR